MKIKKDSIKNPAIKIDKNLNKYRNVGGRDEKVAKANEMLKKIGLPETETLKA
jgi:hypothetical protein